MPLLRTDRLSRFVLGVPLAGAVLLLSNCQGDVAVRPPEKERPAYLADSLGAFVRMNQSDASRYFVSGIHDLEAGNWRWTGRQAALRFQLSQTKNLKYVMRFAVPEPVIARNGPIRLRILINGKKLEELQYQKHGVYEFEKPTPAEMLKPDAENIVTMEIDKPLPSDGRGPELGFILVHAGFRRSQ